MASPRAGSKVLESPATNAIDTLEVRRVTTITRNAQPRKNPYVSVSYVAVDVEEFCVNITIVISDFV